MKIKAKFELLELEIAIFSEKDWFFEAKSLLSNEGLVNDRKLCIKRAGSWEPHIHIPSFSGDCPKAKPTTVQSLSQNQAVLDDMIRW